MACGLALKRPYEYDDYLAGEGAVDSKRARTTHAHCSPFRAQIGTIAASLPATSGTTALLQLRDAKEREEYDTSPFASIAGRTQLSPEQLESYLRAEIRYLKRRRLIPNRRHIGDEGSSAISANEKESAQKRSTLSGNVTVTQSTGAAYRAAPNSPTANSGSDSEGEGSATTANSISGQKTATTLNIYEKPQFSLKQVQMICERLLKQQEVRLRYEYETVLNKRLEEQHEQYVQFAREQIERQHQGTAAEDLSYLS